MTGGVTVPACFDPPVPSVPSGTGDVADVAGPPATSPFGRFVVGVSRGDGTQIAARSCLGQIKDVFTGVGPGVAQLGVAAANEIGLGDVTRGLSGLIGDERGLDTVAEQIVGRQPGTFRERQGQAALALLNRGVTGDGRLFDQYRESNPLATMMLESQANTVGR